ncbi:MAG: DUF488 family protein [Candidatus Cybelea sp.]
MKLEYRLVDVFTQRPLEGNPLAVFHDALAGLLQEAAERPTAIMCSETLWWRCHRRLIADALVLVHGKEVLHLMHSGAPQLHRPTPGARLLPSGALQYDGSEE